MSKYEALARHLAEQEVNSVTMSFEEINEILPNGLPQSAYDYRPWWANRHDGTGSQNQGWQSVGWESSEVDVDKERVTFTRVVRNRADFKDAPYVRPLSIAEAKQGLAAMFNTEASSIDITIRG